MTDEGYDLVKHFEGFYSAPYLCAGGVWTIGFGTTVYPSGRRVTRDDKPCTQGQATVWLMHGLERCEWAVNKLCTGGLSDQQHAAIVSFTYNLGAGALRASTLRRRINSYRWDEVPRQLARWTRASGRINPGLKRRRAAEIDLWNME